MTKLLTSIRGDYIRTTITVQPQFMHSLDDFSFTLPEELIAAEALVNRADSRMLAVDRDRRTFDDACFAELSDFLRPTDVLVLNNTKVFPARLFGDSSTGAKIEIFLVKELHPNVWEALARPAKRLSSGKVISFDKGLSAEVVEREANGTVILQFASDSDLDATIDRVGRTPLPPYIKRHPDSIDRDRERYQTVFAKNRGAIAAPTAGLHFTPEILDDVRSRGVGIVEITLHVGYGTFEPVRVDDISKHIVLPERFEIDTEAAEVLNAARSDGRRIIAVGTTTTRTLEYNYSQQGRFAAENGEADITILPGYSFSAIDGLLTNFHLPKSSLLILVSTFGGHELIMEAYRHAVDAKYRFYSYGDCMLIV